MQEQIKEHEDNQPKNNFYLGKWYTMDEIYVMLKDKRWKRVPFMWWHRIIVVED